MPWAGKRLPPGKHEQYLRDGPTCKVLTEHVERLSDYLEVIDALVGKGALFWFRGQPDFTKQPIPSALRYEREADRDKACDLLKDLKRYAPMKLTQVPEANDELGWLQLGQHYGLPTRLLDWTENAAIGLYFACWESDATGDQQHDGLVFALNPVDLNRQKDPKRPRVFDPHLDRNVIRPYLKLRGRVHPRGRQTIAVNPVWNSERIMLQKGTFTLHGSRSLALTWHEVPSLICVPILSQAKQRLLADLERIGVNEMSIFPEVEHMCHYLKRPMSPAQ